MRIGIVGAGHIGSALAKRLTAAGHDVEIANSRGPDTLADVARETGATAVPAEQAVNGKDAIVLTIPLNAVPKLAGSLFKGVPASVPVIDTCNYYPRERDGRIAAIEDDGLTESEWVAQQIGHPTIKVFNNIYAKRIVDEAKPKGASGRLALPVAGDDPDQKRKVMELVDDIGFDAIDAGPLSESWRYQPATPAYGSNGAAETVKQQLAAASPERTPAFSG